MTKTKLKLTILLVFTLIAVIWVVNNYYKKPQQSQLPQTSPAAQTLDQLLSLIKLPKSDPQIKRVTQKSADYQLNASGKSAVDQTITFESKNTLVSFTPLDNQKLGPVNSQKVQQTANQIIYPNIYNGIDLIYTTFPDKIVEEYEVKTKRAGLTEIIQKIDITGLTYEKQPDGSIKFFKSADSRPASRSELTTESSPAFSIPKPVMYEKYNSRARNYNLHYELITQDTHTFLVKVIDAVGQDWLNKASYPVMIDGTIFTGNLSLESYPVSNGLWQVRLDTVGSADLSFAISPAATFQSLVCGDQTIPVTNNQVANFSCSQAAYLNYQLTSGNYQLQVNFGGEIKTITTSYQPAESKPVFISTSQDPIIVQPGNTITVTAHITDPNGITKVQANLGKTLPTIDLNLSSGTTINGVWQGSWVAVGTGPIEYQTIITATNSLNKSTNSDPIIWSDWTDTGGGDHGGADWTIAADTAIAGVHTNIGTFTVNNTKTATVQAYDGASYGSIDITATTITITGTLLADGKGYRKGAGGCSSGVGEGSGGGTACSGGTSEAGGGGYGGAGGTGYGGIAGGGSYGSSTAPTDLGSGGGSGYSPTAGGNGGGAIRITAGGTITVAGTLSANGGAGNYNGNGAGGGGSGGSLYLTAATIEGAGAITANGGAGGGGGGTGAGGGGGGRISIKYSSSYTYSGTPTINAGAGGTGGQLGTALVTDTTNNDLYIKTSQIWKATTGLEEATPATYRNIKVQNNSTWYIKGYYTTNSDGVGIHFQATDFTIELGSTMTSNGLGYAAGAGRNDTGDGPGGGTGCTGGTTEAGGGGYGGVGGTGYGGIAGGASYGSSTAPTDLGSGGGGGYEPTAGGAGGGAIRITAGGTITVAGTLSANGGAGNYNGNGAGGGGSGGSLYLTAATIEGAGAITANGGAGGGGGGTGAGGGGGGRISIYYTANNWSGNTLDAANSAVKGTGGTGGANGTVTLTYVAYVSPNIDVQFDGDIQIDGDTQIGS